jgi:hypothetical protein
MVEYKSGFSSQALQRLIDDLNRSPLQELVLAERLYRTAKFYTVEPVGGNWTNMEIWCTKTFGPADDVWDFKMLNVGRWYMGIGRFWFRNEADRTVFVMRWSI